MEPRTDLMRGTLDLLILRSLMAMPLHGLGIARRIAQMTQGSFDVKAGSLFPALYRLEERGLVTSEWGESDTRRRAKFYRLTRARQETAAGRRSKLAAHRAGDGPRAGVRIMTPRGSPAALVVRAGAKSVSRRPRAMRSFAPTSRRTSICSPTRRSPPVCRPRRRGAPRCIEFGSVDAVKDDTRSVRAGACWPRSGRTRDMRCG